MLGSSYASYLSKQTNNNFWAQTLNYWSRLIASIPINNTNDALSDSLWNNPKVSKLQLFLPNWFNKGIVSIGDLIYESGDFLSQNIMKKTYNIKTNFFRISPSYYLCKYIHGKTEGEMYKASKTPPSKSNKSFTKVKERK